MAITDKTRKILWAQSGNRCAFCRISLVVHRTAADSESVVGEEAHIISGRSNGPRYDPKFPEAQIDGLDNLVLLCANHHKMIDDQVGSFSVGKLHEIKQRHEEWVDARLAPDPSGSPVRLVRYKKNIPERLSRVTSGKELMELISGSCGMYQDHDENLSVEEADLVGGFLQEVADWVDLSGDLQPIERVRTAKRLQDCLDELDASGFWVFIGSEMQRLEGGKSGPTDWRVRHVSVLRKSNAKIVREDAQNNSK